MANFQPMDENLGENGDEIAQDNPHYFPMGLGNEVEVGGAQDGQEDEDIHIPEPNILWQNEEDQEEHDPNNLNEGMVWIDKIGDILEIAAVEEDIGVTKTLKTLSECTTITDNYSEDDVDFEESTDDQVWECPEPSIIEIADSLAVAVMPVICPTWEGKGTSYVRMEEESSGEVHLSVDMLCSEDTIGMMIKVSLFVV